MPSKQIHHIQISVNQFINKHRANIGNFPQNALSNREKLQLYSAKRLVNKKNSYLCKYKNKAGMPTIFIFFGFRFMFYANDHEPIHVHVTKEIQSIKKEEEDMNIEKIWLTDSAVWIRTADGMEYSEQFADYPRLKFATAEQRNNYRVCCEGIHWDELDEDLCFEGFLHKKERNLLYELFLQHPELNASAIARRIGLSQTQFAQYISGDKKISPKRLSEMIEAIHAVGHELTAITLPQEMGAIAAQSL